MRTSRFTYVFPDHLIAQSPVEPRDAARLLRVSDLSDWTVRDLPALLRPGDLVVVNDTRVRAARLIGRRDPTGGRVEILLLGRRGGRWQALVRPARRLRAGSMVRAGLLAARLETDPVDGEVELSLRTEAGDADPDAIEEAIAATGEVPLPPYIHKDLDDPGRYQTVFADRVGSAAAPTAGLHLTPAILDRLAGRGIGLARIELRIGLATFRPISTEEVADHPMHSEWTEVPEATVERVLETRRSGGRVVAVGTTVVRALESACEGGRMRPHRGSTGLYITPGYRFRAVDVLLTNFHMPRSSLLVLVAALVGDAWRPAYEAAVERGYRFLSFGDAMLLEARSAAGASR